MQWCLERLFHLELLIFKVFQTILILLKRNITSKGSDLMNTIVRGVNLELSNAIDMYVREKFKNINKYFDHLDELEIVLSNTGKRNFQVEALAKVKGHNYILKTENEDMYKAIDNAKLKMKELLIKEKNKIIDKKRKHIA